LRGRDELLLARVEVFPTRTSSRRTLLALAGGAIILILGSVLLVRKRLPGLRREPSGAVRPDQRISHFELLEPIGTGAMGVVYRARDTVLGRDVALKLIRPELTEDKEARGRFLRECRAAAAINHPAIATLYEAGESEDGRLYFAAELIEGETLKDRLSKGRLPLEKVIGLGLQLSEALAASHAAGIIHRDIKPSNLMLTAEERLKVLDFGLARLMKLPTVGDGQLEATRTLTRVGIVVGTPAYMSPEQAAGVPVDARSDVFSSGTVLYEMACGRPAFAAESVLDTLRRIIGEDPTPPEVVDESIPPRLAEIIKKAMAKAPEERFPSGRELAEALRRLESTLASGA
jgi:serine/threonine-protein kinase